MKCDSRFSICNFAWSPAFRRSHLLLCLLLPLAFSLHTFGAQQAWVAKYNLGPQSTNQAVAVALDFNGDLIVAGHGTGGATGHDYILLKYSPAGTQVWARTYTSPDAFNDQIRNMKVDTAGNIFVTGTSATLMYSSGGTLLWEQPYAGRALAVDNEHVYVTGFSNSIFATAKLSKANGSNIWLRTFTVLGGPNGPSEAIALDQSANVLIAGANTCYNHRGVEYVNLYVLAYRPSGADLWTTAWEPNCRWGRVFVKSLVTDAAGDIYVLAGFDFQALLNYGVKLDRQGKVLWTYYLGLGTITLGTPGAMVLDSNGFPHLAGGVYQEGFGHQFTTAKLDPPTGTNIWFQQYGGSWIDQANSLGLDRYGNVYVTGRSAPPDSAYDFATLKYSPEGNSLWVKRFNGPANLHDEAAAIAVSPSGDVYVTGFSTTSSNLVELTTIKYIQIAPIEKKTNGAIFLSFCGTPGSNYIIQASITLTNWSEIGTTTAGPTGVYTFEDTNAPAYPQRFYRTVSE